MQFLRQGTAATVKSDIMVTAAFFDAMCGASLLTVNATQLLGTALATPTTAGIPKVEIAGIATDAINAAGLKADAITKIQVGLATAASLSTAASSAAASAASAADLQTRIPAALDINGYMKAGVLSMASNVLAASDINADAITKIVAGFHDLSVPDIIASLQSVLNPTPKRFHD